MESVAQQEMDLTSGDYLKEWLNIPPQQSLAQSLDPKAYIQAFWDENTRPDGRMFSQARQTKVVYSLLKHSAGSALIKLGETKVLCATTIQIGQPAPGFPDHGDVVVTVTATDHTTHMDSLQGWLQRMMDDLLPSKLALIMGKACIRLHVTAMILQDDGNLMDASLLACMAAWKDTKLPTMDHLKEVQGKLWWIESPISSLDQPMESSSSSSSNHDANSSKDYRVSLSFGILQQDGMTSLLVDPSADESAYCKGTLTMVLSLPSRTLQVEYSGNATLTATDLALASKMANGRADELSQLL